MVYKWDIHGNPIYKWFLNWFLVVFRLGHPILEMVFKLVFRLGFPIPIYKASIFEYPHDYGNHQADLFEKSLAGEVAMICPHQFAHINS